MHLELGLPLRRVTIIPNKRKESLGHVHEGPIPKRILSLMENGDYAWGHPWAFSRALSEICASNGGCIAERLATKKMNHEGAEEDREVAYRWLSLLAPDLATEEFDALCRW